MTETTKGKRNTLTRPEELYLGMELLKVGRQLKNEDGTVVLDARGTPTWKYIEEWDDARFHREIIEPNTKLKHISPNTFSEYRRDVGGNLASMPKRGPNKGPKKADRLDSVEKRVGAIEAFLLKCYPDSWKTFQTLYDWPE